MTALMHAAYCGEAETLQVLINSKACLDNKDEVEHALSCTFVGFDCCIDRRGKRLS